MVKNKSLFSILTIGTAFSLSACALPFNAFNLNEEQTPLTDSVIEETQYTEKQRKIVDLLNKKSASDLSYEEYISLSTLYQNEGYFLDARNTLEEAYKLFMDSALLDKLSGMTINLLEENSSKQDIAKKLLSFMNDKNISEVLKIIESEEFKDIFMDEIYVGKRSFYLSINENPALFIETGFDENSIFTSLIYSIENNCFVKTDGNNAYIEENENNSFIITSILFSNDTVERKTGSIENGLLTGEFIEEVFSFDDYNNSLSNVYANLNTLEKKTFSSSFINGKASFADEIDTIGDDSNEFVTIPYALCTENNKKLYRVKKVKKEDSESFLFDTAFIGKNNPPSINPYNLKAPFISDSKPENISNMEEMVRIHDGNIQLFDGIEWHIVGSVSEYESKDPFKGYSDYVASIKENGNNVIESNTPFSNGTDTVSITEKPAPSTNNNTNTHSGSQNNNQVAKTPTPSTPQPSTPVVSEPNPEPQPSAPASNPEPQPSTPASNPEQQPAIPEENTSTSGVDGQNIAWGLWGPDDTSTPED